MCCVLCLLVLTAIIGGPSCVTADILTFLWPAACFVTAAALSRSLADLWVTPGSLLLCFLPPYSRCGAVCRHHILLSGAEAFGLALGWKRWMNLVGRCHHWPAVT